MSQKSEKIIYFKLKNLILKQIFTELISDLNKQIEDVKLILFDSVKIPSDLPYYLISDEESVAQLLEEDNAKKIKKIFLISSKSVKINTNIEIINYDLPFNFLKFLDYIIHDLRQNFNKQNKIISLKSLSYDESSRRIFNDTISLILTEKENEIFCYLLESDTSVSKNLLLKNIWKYNEGIDTHTLETHIYSLRKKLEKNLEIKNILEHNDKGYLLNKTLL